MKIKQRYVSVLLIQDLLVRPLGDMVNVVLDLSDNEIRKVECAIHQLCYEEGSIVDVDATNVIKYGDNRQWQR